MVVENEGYDWAIVPRNEAVAWGPRFDGTVRLLHEHCPTAVVAVVRTGCVVKCWIATFLAWWAKSPSVSVPKVDHYSEAKRSVRTACDLTTPLTHSVACESWAVPSNDRSEVMFALGSSYPVDQPQVPAELAPAELVPVESVPAERV